MKTLQRKLVWSAVALAIALAGVYLLHAYRSGTVYRVYYSPAKEYKLVVHRFPRPMTVPGDSSSDPGYVELFDSKGERLDKADVPTVLDLSIEENIHWYEEGVSSPGMFAFKLPR